MHACTEETLEEYDEHGKLVGSKKIVRENLPTSRVIVSKDESFNKTDDEIKRKAEIYDELASEASERLNTKYNTTIFSEKNLTEMMVLDKLLSAQQKEPKKSRGSISLRTNSGEPIEFAEDEEGRRAWAEYVMEAKRDPNHPYHERVKQLLKEAKSESKDLLQFLPRKMDFSYALDPAIKDLGYKYGYREKVEWDREQAEKRGRNVQK